MPIMSLTETYDMTGVHKGNDGQKVFLKARHGDLHSLVINGIPNDVDLSGNIQMHTYHVDDLSNPIPDEDKNMAEPDKIEVYKLDDNENVISSYKLFKNPEGGYKLQTEEQKRRTNAANNEIIRMMTGIPGK